MRNQETTGINNNKQTKKQSTITCATFSKKKNKQIQYVGSKNNVQCQPKIKNQNCQNLFHGTSIGIASHPVGDSVFPVIHYRTVHVPFLKMLVMNKKKTR